MEFYRLKRRIAYLLVSALLLSCNQPVLNNIIPETKETLINAKTSRTTITGRAEFPGKFSQKATDSDISFSATVSIIYPSNHSTMPNKTVAASLTDNSGNFTINPGEGFNPQTGDIFRLEAVKRNSGSGSAVSTINTYIKWNGNGWASITTPGVKINKGTTALTIIEINDNSLDPAGTIGKISSVNSAYTQAGTVTQQMFNEVTGLVEDVLLQGLDPMQYILVSGTKYKINNPAAIIASHPDYITYGEFESGGAPDPFEDPFCEFLPPGFPGCSQPSQFHLYIVNPDGSGKRKIIQSSSSVFSDLNTTRDGNFIIFKRNNNGMTYSNVLPEQTSANISDLGNIKSAGSIIPAPDKSKFIVPEGNTKLFITDGNSGAAKRIAIGIGAAGIQDIKWSPDSSKFFFSANNGGTGSRYDLYVYDTKTDISTNLTGTIESVSTITPGSWSPDSTMVLFNVTTGSRNDLYINNARGGSPEIVSDGTGITSEEGKWSPDSVKILWRKQSGVADFDWYITNLSGTPVITNLTNSLAITGTTNGKWAPDSLKVCFEAIVGSDSDTYIAMISGNNTFKITPADVQSEAYLSEPLFSKDSAVVILRAKNNSSRYDLFKVTLNDINNPVNITSAGSSSNHYILGGETSDPTGNKLLIKNAEDNIFSLNNDGTGLTPVTNLDNFSSMQWYSNGKKIVYSKSNDIWIVSPDNTGNTNLSNDTARPKNFFSIHLIKN